MLSQLHQLVPVASLTDDLTPGLAIAYAAVAFIVLAIFLYMLWLLPIQAWFRKPIEVSAECPHCGSKDFRPSYISNAMDRLRKRIGLHPFRCRACTRRFVSRSSGPANEGLASEVETG
jgi:hypothetical protein